MALALVSGVSVSLVAWIGLSLFHELPHENRAWMDRPPVGFRMIWPIIRVMECHASVLLRDGRSAHLQSTLRQAGMAFTLSTRQFRAAQWVFTVAAATVLWMSTAHLPSGYRSLLCVIGAVPGMLLPVCWLKERAHQRLSEIIRLLPYCLDIITLSVESGTHLTGGMTNAHKRLPASALREELGHVLRDIRAGRGRSIALKDFGVRSGSAHVKQIVGGLVQAERSGGNIGQLLRAQAEQLRSERFLRAEKLALEAPVRLLVPLVLFIFPTTFLVLVFLVLSKAIQEGMVTAPVLLWAYYWPT